MLTIEWTDAAAALADREVYPGFRDRGHWYYASGMPVEPEQVTHWMHLPAAPRAGATEQGKQ